MSLLDLDERVLDLFELVQLDRSPLGDIKRFTSQCDIGLIEGGCSSEHDVMVLKDFRKWCVNLVIIGECGISGGVPSLRNSLTAEACLQHTFLKKEGILNTSKRIPDHPALPHLLDRVYPCQEIVNPDHFIPGCPPSADAILYVLDAILHGRPAELPLSLLKYD